MPVEDVVVIGAGPCGLATALQLKRYGIEVVVFEKNRVGGLLNNADLVENYPGFPEGIGGVELVDLFARQASGFGVPIRFEEVLKVDLEGPIFRLDTSGGVCQARTVVVASGTKPIEFTDFQIPNAVAGRVFYEVFPIREVKDKTIAVIGAGDAAFDYALNLSRHNEVTILNRGGQIKALPLLWQRARSNGRINYEENIELLRIDRVADGLRLECKDPTGERELRIDLLVFAIGRTAELGFLSEKVKSVQKHSENLYICGDVVNGPFRQTAIAVGDGIKAAMSIYRQRREQG